ncbi:MAG: methyltransferase domain-containing protein [Caldilineaceae bacterium]|nr:methyltransferase domain-containing protein [Caldilineaceae bacterium]
MMATKDLKASVQHQFNQVAANYSTSAVHAKGRDLEEMLQALPLTGQESVLDAGCGTGHTALAFAPHVAQVVAVDFTQGMLDQGQQLAVARGLTNVTFRLGDVEKLAFPATQFDLVVSRYSAHHWPQPVTALHEFQRVLKPGGHLILDDIVALDDLTCDTYLQAIELLRDPSHVRDHTVAQWIDMLTTAGFVEITVCYTGPVWIDFAAWIKRMATPEANAALIRTLFDGAPQEVRAGFQVDEQFNFNLTGAVIRAKRP